MATSYTHKEFIEKARLINPHIDIIGQFTGVDNKIEIKCNHNTGHSIIAWSLLKKRKYCCRKGYHEQRIPTQLKSVSDRIAQYSAVFGNKLVFTNATLGKTQKLDNIFCPTHNIYFSQWFNSLRIGIGCPNCGKENKSSAGIRMLGVARQKQLDNGNARYVSKSETKWLDSLAIPIRQYWLPDVKYRVDGFDPDTNTVYLFHGRFWHGCPDTYDPEYVHPIVKLKMKQLHEQTVEWEQKITAAGYNLVIEWG